MKHRSDNCCQKNCPVVSVCDGVQQIFEQVKLELGREVRVVHHVEDPSMRVGVRVCRCGWLVLMEYTPIHIARARAHTHTHTHTHTPAGRPDELEVDSHGTTPCLLKGRLHVTLFLHQVSESEASTWCGVAHRGLTTTYQRRSKVCWELRQDKWEQALGVVVKPGHNRHKIPNE